MTFRRTAALAIAVLLVAAPGAQAQDRPPRTTLIAGREQQAGRLQNTWCWGGPLCVAGTGPYFPGGAEVRRGTDARIRIRYPLRPTELRLRGWRDIECGIDSCWGVGRGRDVKYTLRPVLRGPEVVRWSVRFELPRKRGHLYLLMRSEWSPVHFASWTFHVRMG